MMKITATTATPYSAVELTPVDDVLVIVAVAAALVMVVVDPGMVMVDTTPAIVVVIVVGGPTTVVTDVAVVVDVVVVVLVTVVAVAVGTPCRVKATTSPETVPGQVATASGLHAPIGVRMYSCPLTAAPIDTPTSIGAPM